MEINWPGEKLLIKLCDTVGSKGIGSLLKPWQMRREGAAAVAIKRLNSLTLAQTKIEVGEIQAGKKVLLPSGKLEPVGAPDALVTTAEAVTRFEIIAELEKVVEASVQKEAFRKEVSIAKAVLFAEQELEQETQPAMDAPVSDDWLLRWRDNAAAVSSEELQALWGKVLAGDVKSPGAFSLRTLEFLKNISQEDASLIERLSPYVINNCVVRPITPDGSLGDLNFGGFMQLQELGIIAGVEALGLTTEIASSNDTSFVKALTSHGRVLLVTHVVKSEMIRLPIFVVTRLGLEVMRLGWKRSDEQYLIAVGQRLKGMGFEVQLGNCTRSGDDVLCTDLLQI